MLKLILYIIVGLVVLSFFGISVQHVIESPTTQANFNYVGDLVREGWDNIVAQINAIWHTIA